jgi:hypothetical protein
MPDNLQALLDYCRNNRRNCPQPMRWNYLYQMLPAKRRVGAGFEPAAPLILAAWWEATDEQKQERLTLHLRWAETHGAIDEVAEFLRSLRQSDWHHADD